MGKIYMNELASALALKHGITLREAQQFITALVETIQSGVTNDRIVKIKGLGTFKIIGVEARESVNVNTGERVMIDSHSKLSFTPDNAMKELVNRPFSQFQTVVLNDGVDFSDMEDTADEETEAENEPEVETVSEPEPVVKPEPVVTPEPEPEVSEPEPEPEVSEPEPVADVQEDVAEETEDESDADEDEQPRKRRVWIWWLLAVIVALGMGFAAGYYVGQGTKNPAIVPVTPKPAEPQPLVPEQPVAIEEEPEEKSAEPAVEEVVQEPQPAAETASPEQEWARYEAMDIRVKKGAYHIVGFDRTVEVRQGETTARIARRTLGEGMECYIEVYNNITASTPLEAGMVIKIPAVKLKDAARRRLQQNRNQ